MHHYFVLTSLRCLASAPGTHLPLRARRWAARHPGRHSCPAASPAQGARGPGAPAGRTKRKARGPPLEPTPHCASRWHACGRGGLSAAICFARNMLCPWWGCEICDAHRWVATHRERRAPRNCNVGVRCRPRDLTAKLPTRSPQDRTQSSPAKFDNLTRKP